MIEETVFRWECDNVSKLTSDYRHSPDAFFVDLPWYISVYRVCNDNTSNVLHLGVYLTCNEESECDRWKVEHDSTISIVHRTNEKNNIAIPITKEFTKIHSAWGREAVAKFDGLLKPTEGFVMDDKIIVEARIKVTAVAGIDRFPPLDFTSPVAGISEFPLIVEGKKLYVCKQLLAMHSPVFATMFLGNFKEKNQSEIELKEVGYEEFLELLRMIYPSGGRASYFTEGSLLELADQFDIRSVKVMVEQYLMGTVEVSMILERADRFKLNMLKAHCLSKFESLEEIKTLKDTPTFREFSDGMKAALCERMMNLIE